MILVHNVKQEFRKVQAVQTSTAGSLARKVDYFEVGSVLVFPIYKQWCCAMKPFFLSFPSIWLVQACGDDFTVAGLNTE